MNPFSSVCDRREFAKTALLAGSALSLGTVARTFAAAPATRRIKTGVIGCGSVSRMYLPDLSQCPYVELVSVCDIRPERRGAGGAVPRPAPICVHRGYARR